MERLIHKDEMEYKALEYACARMNIAAEKLGYAPKYYVGDCYFDFGQNWMWTTIIYDKDGDGFQALYPNEQASIINGLFDVEDIVERQVSILHKEK